MNDEKLDLTTAVRRIYELEESVTLLDIELAKLKTIVRYLGTEFQKMKCEEKLIAMPRGVM